MFTNTELKIDPLALGANERRPRNRSLKLLSVPEVISVFVVKITAMFECLLQLWPSSLFSQTLVVGVVVGLVANLLLKKRHKWPPGPRGIPLIGNMFSLYNKLWYKELFNWTKTYGPILDCKLATKHVVVLSNIDLVQEAFLKRGSDVTGRANGPSGEVFTEGNKDIVNATYGPRWKLHRRLASKALRNYLQGDNLSKELTKSMSILSRMFKKEEGPFDPYQYLALTAFNMLSGMCFSKTSPDTNDERFKQITELLATITTTLFGGILEDFLPLLIYCPTAKFKKYEKACNDLHDILKHEVDEHKKTLSASCPRNFLDAMLVAQTEAEKEEDPELLAQITDVHIRQTVQDILFAGIDTTRTTLYWCVLALALYPDVQKKIQKEVDSVIGPDLAVDVKDRDRLSYTDAVLHEVMRMRPGAPIGVPRETIRDTQIGGYEIPKGTTVGMNVYALHHDPNHWDEPFKFRPERFLDDSGKMEPKPDSWLPFSAGRRVCLGEMVAKPELHLFLAGICRGFTIELAPGTTHDFEPKGAGFQMLPGSFEVFMKPRI